MVVVSECKAGQDAAGKPFASKMTVLQLLRLTS